MQVSLIKGHQDGNFLRLAGFLILACAVVFSSQSVLGKTVQFDIPSQELSAALDSFAEQTKYSMLYSLKNIGHVITRPVMGHYSPEKALDIMLKGTGLAFRMTSQTTISIRKNHSQAEVNSKPKVDASTDSNKKVESLPTTSQADNTDQATQPDNVSKSLTKKPESESHDDYILEDTVVTATKRAERMQDIPQAITAFSEDELNFIGARNFGDLVESLPGVEFRNREGAGRGDINIRGISELSRIQGGPGATVGYYLDELPLTMAGWFADIANLDVARVEILRGPQGTLYGEGSLAGTIRLISNKPDTTAVDAWVDLSYADTKGGATSSTVNAMVNVPLLKDKAAIRLIGSYQENGGWIDILDPHSDAVRAKDANDDETISGRMALRATPSDRLTLDGMVLYSNTDANRENYATREGDKHSLTQEFADDELLGLNLTVAYDFPFAELISSTSHFDRDITGIMDFSPLTASVVPLFGALDFLMPMFGLPGPNYITPDGVILDIIVNSEAISQELRLVSTGDGPWQWVLGAFYKKQEQRYFLDGDAIPAPDRDFEASIGLLPIPGFAGSPAASIVVDASGTFEQYAGFGEISYNLSEKLTLTGAGRFFLEERDAVTTSDGYFLEASGISRGMFTSSGDETIFNPKLLLRYKFTDDLMTYAQYSKGFRSGGQNVFLLTDAPPFFDPETLSNYEIGLKSTFWQDRARLNMAAYYMDWKDLQAEVASGVAGAGGATGNVGDAHSMGVDLEFYLRPIRGLSWTAGATFLQAETDDDFELSGGTVPSGTSIPNAAELLFNTAVQYNFLFSETLWGFVRTSYSYSGESRAGLQTNDPDTPAYEIVNFRAGIERENWQLTFFVDNLLDEDIIYRAAGSESDLDMVGLEPEGSLSVGLPISQVGRPRTFGVRLKINM